MFGGLRARHVKEDHGDVFDEPCVFAVVEVKNRDPAIVETKIVRAQVSVDEAVAVARSRSLRAASALKNEGQTGR